MLDTLRNTLIWWSMKRIHGPLQEYFRGETTVSRWHTNRQEVETGLRLITYEQLYHRNSNTRSTLLLHL